MGSGLQALGLLLLGWLLGLLSPLIVERVRNTQRRREVSAAILTELQDLKAYMAVTAHTIASHYGILDRELLTWVVSKTTDYTGVAHLEADGMAEEARETLKLTDEQLQAQNAQLKTRLGRRMLSLKKFDLQFLAAHLHDIAAHKPQVQHELFQVRTQLRMLHEHIDQVREFAMVVYRPGLEAVQYQAAIQNAVEGHRTILTRCRLIGELADTISIE